MCARSPRGSPGRRRCASRVLRVWCGAVFALPAAAPSSSARQGSGDEAATRRRRRRRRAARSCAPPQAAPPALSAALGRARPRGRRPAATLLSYESIRVLEAVFNFGGSTRSNGARGRCACGGRCAGGRGGCVRGRGGCAAGAPHGALECMGGADRPSQQMMTEPRACELWWLLGVRVGVLCVPGCPWDGP